MQSRSPAPPCAPRPRAAGSRCPPRSPASASERLHSFRGRARSVCTRHDALDGVEIVLREHEQRVGLVPALPRDALRTRRRAPRSPRPTRRAPGTRAPRAPPALAGGASTPLPRIAPEQRHPSEHRPAPQDPVELTDARRQPRGVIDVHFADRRGLPTHAPPASRPRSSRETSSTSVFHAMHEVQRPTHSGKIAPHAWQNELGGGFGHPGRLAPMAAGGNAGVDGNGAVGSGDGACTPRDLASARGDGASRSYERRVCHRGRHARPTTRLVRPTRPLRRAFAPPRPGLEEPRAGMETSRRGRGDVFIFSCSGKRGLPHGTTTE